MKPRHFYILAAVIFAVSLMKGLRLPTLWAATQMTFNYSHGFIRRGFLGEVLWLVSGGRLFRYGALLLIAVLLFAGVGVTVGRMIRRAVRLDVDDTGLMAVILVFAASPGVVFWAHIIGYLDYVGLLAVATFVLWSARASRPGLIYPVGTAMVVGLGLIHESMVVMFLPTVLFAMTCRSIAERQEGGATRLGSTSSTVRILMSAAVAIGAAIAICVLGTRDIASMDALERSIAAHANFHLRHDAFEPLRQPVSRNLLDVMPAMFRFHPHHAMQVVHGLIVSSVGLIAMGGYALRLIDRIGLTERERAVVVVGFIAATLTPLSLNLFGWDTARWNAVCVFDAFACIVILKLMFTARVPDPAAHRIDGAGGLTLSAIAVVLGLVSNYDLFFFDGRVVQWFPFDDQLKAFFSLAGHGFQLTPDR